MYKLFTLASWPRCGASSCRAGWARRGDRPWAKKFGPLFAASQAYGPMATTFFSSTIRLSRAGETAVAAHRGPYNLMNEAHNAIRKWMMANRRESAGHSWEIYGYPAPDPADAERTVVYLLK